VFPLIRFTVPILSLTGLGYFIAFAVFTFAIVTAGYGVEKTVGGSLYRGYVFVGAVSVGNLAAAALHTVITPACLLLGL
jgi:hypothetical protein